MTPRILAALVALAVVPFAATGADEENPYKRVKVGDWAIYKTSTNVCGISESPFLPRETVTVKAKDDKEVTFQISVGSREKKKKIELTKPFHPAIIEGLLFHGDDNVLDGSSLKFEKLKSGEEKLKISLKEYMCQWETYKITFSDNGRETARKESMVELEAKIWRTKEFAFGIVKTEFSTTLETEKFMVTTELESGSMKSE